MGKPKYKGYPSEKRDPSLTDLNSVDGGSKASIKILKLQEKIIKSLSEPENLEKAVSIIKSWINQKPKKP